MGHYDLFLFFCCPDAILAPFWLHLGGYGTHLGSIWKVFWDHVGSNVGAKLPVCLGLSGARADTRSLDGQVGLKNLLFLSDVGDLILISCDLWWSKQHKGSALASKSWGRVRLD